MQITKGEEVMPNPNTTPSAWNDVPRLGGFIPAESTTHPEQLTFAGRVRQFTDWALGAVLTAPSQAPNHMSEHYRLKN